MATLFNPWPGYYDQYPMSNMGSPDSTRSRVGGGQRGGTPRQNNQPNREPSGRLVRGGGLQRNPNPQPTGKLPRYNYPRGGAPSQPLPTPQFPPPANQYPGGLPPATTQPQFPNFPTPPNLAQIQNNIGSTGLLPQSVIDENYAQLMQNFQRPLNLPANMLQFMPSGTPQNITGGLYGDMMRMLGEQSGIEFQRSAAQQQAANQRLNEQANVDANVGLMNLSNAQYRNDVTGDINRFRALTNLLGQIFGNLNAGGLF